MDTNTSIWIGKLAEEFVINLPPRQKSKEKELIIPR